MGFSSTSCCFSAAFGAAASVGGIGDGGGDFLFLSLWSGILDFNIRIPTSDSFFFSFLVARAIVAAGSQKVRGGAE